MTRSPSLLLACVAELLLGCSSPASPVAPDGGVAGASGSAGAASVGGGGGSDPAGGSAGSDPGAGGASGASPSDLSVVPAEFTGINQPLRLLADGDTIDLVVPPQGGHVMFIGAQVKNLNTDTVELRSRLRDAVTNAIVAEEGRTVVMQKLPDDPSTSQPILATNSQVSQPALCPDYSAKDINNTPYILEVVVRELYVDVPRTVSATRMVTPTCANTSPEDQSVCACECGANYVLGKCPPSKTTH